MACGHTVARQLPLQGEITGKAAGTLRLKLLMMMMSCSYYYHCYYYPFFFLPAECHSNKAGLLLCGRRYQRRCRYQNDTGGIDGEINIIKNIGADN